MGGSFSLILLESSYSCYLGTHAKFQTKILINFLAKSGNSKHFWFFSKKKIGGGVKFSKKISINFLAKSGNYKHFSFFSKKKKIGGGGKIFKKKFRSIFSQNQAILSTFRFFQKNFKIIV